MSTCVQACSAACSLTAALWWHFSTASTPAVLACHHELYPAVVVLLVVNFLKRRHLLVALFRTDEWATCEHSSSGIALLRTGSRYRHTDLRWTLSHPTITGSSVFASNCARRLQLGVAVVRLVDQWLLTTLVDPLVPPDSAHQLRFGGW